MANRPTRLLAIGLGLCALAAAPVRAQPQVQVPAAQAQEAPATPVCCVVPAGTEIAVELVDAVGTASAKSGDLFPIRLAAPVIVDGQVVLPAGTPGVGRVVQSSGPGIGGKGGKLIVSAEYLTVPGGAVKLSGMQLTGTGKDRSTTANVLGLGGIAFAPAGILGIAVTGGDAQIPAGTAAAAKVAETVTLPPVAAATQADFALDWKLLGSQQQTRGWLDIPPPPPGMGQVVFFRRKTMTGIQWFNVREDGQALAKLTTGTYFILPLKPGLHSFTAKSEPELKDHLTLKIDPGETYYVESVMTHGLVLGAAELTPSDKARFDAISGELKPAEVKTAAAEPPVRERR